MSDTPASDLDAPSPPGPSGLPLVGNTFQLIREPLAFLDELSDYGDVVGYEVAGMRFCALFHPEQVERVLVRESDGVEKLQFGDFGAELAPEGVLLTDGEQWRTQRRILQDAFTLDRIGSYADAMTADTVDTVDGWADGAEIALNRELSALTLRILGRTLFDVDITERSDAIADTAAAVNDRADTRSIAAFLPSWIPTPTQRRYDRAMAAFDREMTSLIEETRGTDGDDLLSLLLAAHDAGDGDLSEREVRDNLLTFLFAGHETTALALTYTLLLLATHDGPRERLRAEIDEVLGDDPPTVDDLDDLSYTDRVLTEALRLYPPAYAVFRRTTRDFELDGYRIPHGTNLTIPQFRIHRDDRFYDEPSAFRPDRWTDEFEADLPEYAYFPFGGGPRHCIGMRFATLELKLVLPTILQRVEFDLLSDPEPELSAGATLRPASDIEMQVRRRDDERSPQ